LTFNGKENKSLFIILSSGQFCLQNQNAKKKSEKTVTKPPSWESARCGRKKPRKGSPGLSACFEVIVSTDRNVLEAHAKDKMAKRPRVIFSLKPLLLPMG
jgi:hypothetical protein